MMVRSWQHVFTDVHPTWQSYFVAVVVSGMTAVLTGLTWPHHPQSRFLFVFPGCVWVSLKLGALPGMVAALVATAGAVLWLLPPLAKESFSITGDQFVGLVLFLVITLWINHVANTLRWRAIYSEQRQDLLQDEFVLLREELEAYKMREVVFLQGQARDRITSEKMDQLQRTIEELRVVGERNA